VCRAARLCHEESSEKDFFFKADPARGRSLSLLVYFELDRSSVLGSVVLRSVQLGVCGASVQEVRNEKLAST